jgi:hypothetical protein
MRECKHCKQSFNLDGKSKGWFANHSRWCIENPKRKEYTETAKKLNVFKKNFRNQFSKAKVENREIHVSEETRNKFRESARGRKLSDSTKAKISESSLKSTHRRLRRNPIVYNGVLMDSTWEVELAKRLDSLEIKWERPEPIKWIDNHGKTRNYFPDFYVPEYDLYLDPKNVYAFSKQKEKIEVLLKTYDNIFFLRTIEECSQINRGWFESCRDH